MPPNGIAEDSGGNTKYAEYTYLGAATVVQLKYPAVTDAGSNPLVLTYGTGGTYGGFDAFGRVVDQKWQFDGGSTLDRFTYGYDRNSNRLYRKNEHTDATSFDELYHDSGASASAAYDGLDRLNQFRRGTLTTVSRTNDTITDANMSRGQEFTLEALGNWNEFKLDADGDGNYTDTNTEEVDQNRSHNLVNEIHNATEANAITEELGDQPSWVSPVYDSAGNMVEGPQAGFGTEADTEETHLHFVYDAWNRLAKVWEDDGDGELDGEDTLLEVYRYDGLGRRVRKLHHIGETLFYTVYDDYYSTGWQVLETRYQGSTEAPEMESWLARYQYVWGIRYIDAPILRDEDTDLDEEWDDGPDGAERLFYTQDANFNVTALVETDGDVAERYVYDPYGKPTIYDDDWSDTTAWADSKRNDILYCGYRYDAETGLYHVRHRVYHPTVGRWMQRDPTGYADGLSLYQYVVGNPLTGRDPSGNISLGTKMAAIIVGRLASLVGRAGTGWIDNYIYTKYILQDDERELQNEFDETKIPEFYVRCIEASTKKITLKWATFSTLPLKHRAGGPRARWASDIYLLHKPHYGILAFGTFQAKCRVNAGKIEWWVRNRNVDWTWQDEIDAKSAQDFIDYGEGKKSFWDTIEMWWDRNIERWGRTNFDVDIKWTDNRRNATKVKRLR